MPRVCTRAKHRVRATGRTLRRGGRARALEVGSGELPHGALLGAVLGREHGGVLTPAGTSAAASCLSGARAPATHPHSNTEDPHTRCSAAGSCQVALRGMTGSLSATRTGTSLVNRMPSNAWNSNLERNTHPPLGALRLLQRVLLGAGRARVSPTRARRSSSGQTLGAEP